MKNIEQIVTQLQSYGEFTATYDPEEDRLRLYCPKRISKEDYTILKEEFSFRPAPKQGYLFTKWSPSTVNLLTALCGEVADEDTSLAQRAEERAQRFEHYSENRQADAQKAYDGVNAIAQFIPPGQPILCGHHSERRHRRDIQRMDNGMRRASRMWDTADYWKERAQIVREHAQYKLDADVRYRRIERLKPDLRRYEGYLQKPLAFISQWESEEMTLEKAKTISTFASISNIFPLDKYPRSADISQSEDRMSLQTAMDEQIITPQQAKDLVLKLYRHKVETYQPWIDHIRFRILYEQEMICDEVGQQFEDKWKAIQVGGKITVSKYSEDKWLTVVKVNKRKGKLSSVWAWDETKPKDDVFGTWKYTPEKIKAYHPPEKRFKPAKLITCNYPGEEIREMTSEEWRKTPRYYKGTPLVEKDGLSYKVREVMFQGKVLQVFLSDKKVVYPPAQS